MGGTCDPQLEGAQARSRARSNIAGPPRGPAPSRRSITGHGAQKAGAHTLRASACATAAGAGGRVSTPPACLHRSSVGEEVAGSHAWGRLQAAACSRRARFCDAVARRVGRGFGGQKQPGRICGIGASRGRIGGVLGAFRGVGGDARGPWPCHWHARITQRRRVGELEPELCFLGVSGEFHELVKRRKNRLRASRARSGGASGRAQPAAFARHARRRLAGLARRAGRGRAKCT